MSSHRPSVALERAFALVVLAGVLVLAGLAWAAHEQYARLDETTRWADRTRGAVGAIQTVSRSVLEAEAAERGVLLGAEGSEERLRDAIAHARANLVLIGGQIQGDSDQQQNLELLREAVNERFGELQRTIALAPTDRGQALEIVHAANGRRLMQEISGATDAMTTHEQARLDDRVAVARAVRRSTERFAGGALAVLFLVVATAAVMLIRELRLRSTMTAALLESRARLEDGERRLKAITDNVPALIGYVDRNQVYRFVNEAYRPLFGLDPGSLLGRTIREALGPQAHDWLRPRIEGALAGEPQQFEKQGMGLAPDATFLVSYLPDVDAADGVDGFYVQAIDISDRKRIETELATSERRLRAITDNLPAVISRFDAQHRCTFANEQFRHVYGVEPASMLGRTQREFRGEAVWAQVGDHAEAAARGVASQFEVFAVIRGQPTWLQQSLIPDVDADGRVLGYLSVSFDVTERRRQEEALKIANERIEVATESGGIGIWELDVARGTLLWDKRMHKLFGDADASGGEPMALWSQRLHSDDLLALAAEMQLAIDGDRPLDREFRVVWPDGSVRHLRGTARAVRDAEGRPQRLVGANWDITELRQLAADLAEDRSLLSVTLKSIGDAIITTDARGVVTWLNPVAERLTGWMSAEAQGRPLAQVFHVVHEETREPAADPVATCLARDAVVEVAERTLLLSRNGQEYGIENSAAPIRGEDGDVLGVVLIFHDVSEQRRLSGEMNWRATHDALTGLVNRTEFESRLQRVLENAHEEDSEHALLYIDLDQFKLVNDACGHAVGDQLLQQVAKLLADAVRTRDTLARLGGDEFAIVMEHCSSDQAMRIAQKICDRMDDFRFIHEERRFRIGASIGLVPVDKRWTGTDAIRQAADTACYAAKEAGRNRVHAWFDTDVALRERRGEMQWTTRIEQALDDDGFVLFAQRIESLGAPAGGLHAEVLLRMAQADGTLAGPGAFLPAAERFHLASRIDRWVLRHVVDWMKALPDPERVELLSVNLSGQSVGDRSFHRWALELLQRAGPRLCGALCLEITETAAVTNMADAAIFVEQVRAVGVRVALDDFGSGAASFGYLKTLEVDMLKIDGQFVRDLVDDPLDEAAVRCFADVAKLMGLKTVAEFVDKPGVLQRLKAMGIDFAQGYLLHQPAPIAELLAPEPAVS